MSRLAASMGAVIGGGIGAIVGEFVGDEYVRGPGYFSSSSATDGAIVGALVGAATGAALGASPTKEEVVVVAPKVVGTQGVPASELRWFP